MSHHCEQCLTQLTGPHGKTLSDSCPGVDEAARLSVRPEVLAFALLMEDRLQANDHKGGWADCADEYLLRRLQEEVNELHVAMRDRPLDVGEEAADVANFAMMLADVSGHLRQDVQE